jgi:hypothetical protein
MRFDERIGGVLAAPRSTFARLGAGEARPGDVAWLMAFRLVAGELDRFARAFAVGREFGVGAAAQEILMITRVLLPDIVGILAAGVLLQLFARSKHAFDVAAYTWIPYLTVTLADALYFTARGYAPSPRTLSLVEGAGVAWAAATWIIALMTMRKEPVAEAKS